MLILRHHFVMLFVLQGTGFQFIPVPIKINRNYKFSVSTGLEEQVPLALSKCPLQMKREYDFINFFNAFGIKYLPTHTN